METAGGCRPNSNTAPPIDVHNKINKRGKDGTQSGLSGVAFGEATR